MKMTKTFSSTAGAWEGPSWLASLRDPAAALKKTGSTLGESLDRLDHSLARKFNQDATRPEPGSKTGRVEDDLDELTGGIFLRH